MTEASASSQQSRTVRQIIDERIRALQQGYLANRSASVAALARLRRGLGKPTGSVVDILEYTTAPEFVRGWDRDEPSRAETAAHHAMTLYALHQQSQSRHMHTPGRPLGSAVRRLLPGEAVKPEDAIARRFTMLGTSQGLEELVHHLRGMVQLLRAGQVPLDYGLLTSQLVAWQMPGGPARVRLVWGRDFHLFKSSATEAGADADAGNGAGAE